MTSFPGVPTLMTLNPQNRGFSEFFRRLRLPRTQNTDAVARLMSISSHFLLQFALAILLEGGR